MPLQGMVVVLRLRTLRCLEGALGPHPALALPWAGTGHVVRPGGEHGRSAALELARVLAWIQGVARPPPHPRPGPEGGQEQEAAVSLVQGHWLPEALVR